MESPVKIKGLGQVMLLASNLDDTTRFYKEVLGFTEASEQMLSPGITLEAGSASIYICGGGVRREQPDDERAGFHVSFIVASTRESFDNLKAAGIPIAVDHHGNEHFASFSLLDPDGVAVEIWGRP